MIGFTVQGDIINEEGATELVTVILSLDVDAAESKGKPGLDVRQASNDNLIGMFAVEDVYRALYEIKSQLGDWEREQEKARVLAAT